MRDEGPVTEARAALLHEQVRRLKMANDLEAGILVPLEKVLAMDRETCSMWNTLRVRFEQESAPDFHGASEERCRELIAGFLDKIGELLASGTSRLEGER